MTRTGHRTPRRRHARRDRPGPWVRCAPHLAIPRARDQHSEARVALLTLALRHERAAWDRRFRRPLKARREHAASREFGWLALCVQVAQDPVLRIYRHDLRSWNEMAAHLGWEWLPSAGARFERFVIDEIARVKAEHGEAAWPGAKPRPARPPRMPRIGSPIFLTSSARSVEIMHKRVNFHKADNFDGSESPQSVLLLRSSYGSYNAARPDARRYEVAR